MTSTFLTSIGFLQPSPVLERLALEQVDLGKSPFARDGAIYLRRYGSKEIKPLVWQRLVRWHETVTASSAEDHIRTGKLTADESEHVALMSDLVGAYVAAQAWVLTPEEAIAVRTLLGEKVNEMEACRFHCGDTFSVAAHKGQFAIYSRANDNADHVASPLEYLNPKERLHYSVGQYSCANIKTLQDKLLQFPAGSEFAFAYEFTLRDRDGIVEISNFLHAHGYTVANPLHWSFLPPNPSR